MQLSKQSVDPATTDHIHQILYQVIADISDNQEANKFLQDLLTDAELTALAKRLAIAQFLEQGDSYDQIRERLKVSSATIASVQERLNNNAGLRLALKKIKTDQWAEQWTNRILLFLGFKPADAKN